MEEKSSRICQKISKIDNKLKHSHSFLYRFEAEKVAPKSEVKLDNSGIDDIREVKDVLECAVPQVRCKKLAYQKIHIRNKYSKITKEI